MGEAKANTLPAGAAVLAARSPVVDIARASAAIAPALAPRAQREVPWPPIPPSESAIMLPADHYLHRGAPTEWWWHVGTLTGPGGRVFGFEINAASFEGRGFGFTQIMLTDVNRSRHYQRTTSYLPPVMFDGSAWAEFDPTRDWYARLGSPLNCLSAIQVTSPGSGYASAPRVEITGGGAGSGAVAVAVLGSGETAGQVVAVALLSPGIAYTSVPTVTLSGGGGSGATAQALHTYVTMDGAWPDPSQGMAVKALLNDEATGTEVSFDLSLSQKGPAFIVWGTGVQPVPDTCGGHLQTNNYYYSLTRLQASGTVTFGGQSVAVTGVTWMDHEYGAFGKTSTPKWILQDMQLDNGVCISNSTSLASNPISGQPVQSHATVQRADGTTYLVPSMITPSTPWKSPATGKTYFTRLKVEIPAFEAVLEVMSLVPAQEFPVAGSPIYEGVAGAVGTFEGKHVQGTAWNEQALV